MRPDVEGRGGRAAQLHVRRVRIRVPAQEGAAGRGNRKQRIVLRRESRGLQTGASRSSGSATRKRHQSDSPVPIKGDGCLNHQVRARASEAEQPRRHARRRVKGGHVCPPRDGPLPTRHRHRAEADPARRGAARDVELLLGGVEYRSCLQGPISGTGGSCAQVEVVQDRVSFRQQADSVIYGGRTRGETSSTATILE